VTAVLEVAYFSGVDGRGGLVPVTVVGLREAFC